ncbi:MAG TPA: ankyrin repeat domain-containing protein [Acidobacteriota bacterium]|nr:ankyrin repeat domain-containing protein [Acidobacteriota bacterium]
MNIKMSIFFFSFLFSFFCCNVSMCTESCDDLLLSLEKNDNAEAIRLINILDNYECRNQNGMTPLLLAFHRPWLNTSDRKEIIALLIEKKANVNAVVANVASVLDDMKGETPLMVASSLGMEDIVKLLLSHGADINAQTDYGKSAVMLAAEIGKGNATIVKLLIDRGCNLKIRTKTGENILLAAIKGSSGEKLETVKILIDKGVDVNCKNDMGETSLQWAAFYGHYVTVKLLIENGAAINDADNKGKTCLMWASGGPDPNANIVKLLIENKSDLDQKDKLGKTAYFYALEDCNTEIAQILADAGADTIPHNRICKNILKKAKKEGCLPKVQNNADSKS